MRVMMNFVHCDGLLFFKIDQLTSFGKTVKTEEFVLTLYFVLKYS